MDEILAGRPAEVNPAEILNGSLCPSKQCDVGDIQYLSGQEAETLQLMNEAQRLVFRVKMVEMYALFLNPYLASLISFIYQTDNLLTGTTS